MQKMKITVNANGEVGFFAYMTYALWEDAQSEAEDICTSSGTVDSVPTSEHLVADQVNGTPYPGALVECEGQVRLIVGWDADTKTMMIYPAWDTPPSPGSTWVAGKIYAYVQTPFFAAKNPFERVILNEVRWQPEATNDLALYTDDDDSSPAVSVSDASVAHSFDIAAKSHSVKISYDGSPQGWALDEILLTGRTIRRE